VTDTEPRNNLAWRVSVLEAEMKAIKDGKPDVVADRVAQLSERVNNLRLDMNTDMTELRHELDGQRRILIGFFVTLAIIGITAIATIVTSGVAG
jgi:hypothetical protein